MIGDCMLCGTKQVEVNDAPDMVDTMLGGPAFQDEGKTTIVICKECTDASLEVTHAFTKLETRIKMNPEYKEFEGFNDEEDGE